MNDRMFSELTAVLENVQGDIIDFRVYKGATFAYLVKLASLYNRYAVGMDTFYGLEVPTQDDYNEHNQLPFPKGYAPSNIQLVYQAVNKVCPQYESYEIHSGKLDVILPQLRDRKYAVVMLDLLHYNPTKLALEYIKDKMADGGVIYCLNYNKSSTRLASKAINQLVSVSDDIKLRPQVVINGNVINVGVIECGSPVVTKPKVTKSSTITKIKSLSNKATRKATESKINIALVLRTGGDTYDYRYVNALARNIREKSTIPIKISVLTDDGTGIDTTIVDSIIPLIHDFKGWWSKIELFRPGIFEGETVVFFDLDTVIVSNIDDILKHKTMFSGINDLYHHNVLQTGVMIWNPNYNNHVYKNFLRVSSSAMKSITEGDAKWIRDNVYNYEFLQTSFINRIVSYKAHCLNHSTEEVKIPAGASIVCFHGKPRPHTITNPAITRHWLYQ